MAGAHLRDEPGELEVSQPTAHEPVAALLPASGEKVAPHRVLVFDDDVAIRELVHRLLVEEGYAVTAAATLDEAREALAKQHVDIALLDVVGQDLGLVGALREHDPKLPIFLFTALDADKASAIVESLPYEGVGLILKPFNLDDLLRTIRQAL